MPIWPSSRGIKLTQNKSSETDDSANISRLDCDVHVGTHVDAPRHFIENGATVEQLPLDIMVGTCFVAYLPEITSISSADLAGIDMPHNIRRLLLRTRNSELWSSQSAEFNKHYVALTADAARWVIEKEISLIGIDYLSVQRYQDGPAAHRILLQADTIILEGLNLMNVQPGVYELICLPIKLVGADGAPARVVLRKPENLSGKASCLKEI
jgi:arylformamidase